MSRKTETLFENYDCYKGKEDFTYHSLYKLFKTIDFKFPLLDIGCGNGVLLNLFKDKEHLGIDPSDLAIRLSKEKGINVLKSKIDYFESDKKFRSIICIGLVGTINHKDVLIKKIRDLLDNEGKAYITFPHNTFFCKGNDDIEKSFELFEINDLIRNNGLKIVKIIGLNKFKIIKLCKNIMVVVQKK